MRVIHTLPLVLRSRLVFDDSTVFNVESAGAGDADSRSTGTPRLLGSFKRRLARAKTPTDVRNGHV